MYTNLNWRLTQYTIKESIPFIRVNIEQENIDETIDYNYSSGSN